jgi:hypothetical protein
VGAAVVDAATAAGGSVLLGGGTVVATWVDRVIVVDAAVGPATRSP